MKNNNSKVLYTGAKILLGLIIVAYFLLLISFFSHTPAEGIFTRHPNLDAFRITYYLFPLILLVAGFFLVKNYLTITGFTFFGFCLIYLLSWQLFLKADAIGVIFPFIGCPLVVSTTFDSLLFLASALIRPRQDAIQAVQVEAPISLPAERRNRLLKFDIGVIPMVFVSLSVLDFLLIVMTFVIGGNLSQGEFLNHYGNLFLLVWGLWPIINIMGFVIGLIGVFLNNKKAILWFVMDIFQMIILGVLWFFSIFAFL